MFIPSYAARVHNQAHVVGRTRSGGCPASCLALVTLGAGHDQARVREVPLAVLGGVDVGAPALHLHAVRTDSGVDGHGVGALGLLGGTLALDLAAFGIAVGTKSAHTHTRQKR